MRGFRDVRVFRRAGDVRVCPRDVADARRRRRHRIFPDLPLELLHPALRGARGDARARLRARPARRSRRAAWARARRTRASMAGRAPRDGEAPRGARSGSTAPTRASSPRLSVARSRRAVASPLVAMPAPPSARIDIAFMSFERTLTRARVVRRSVPRVRGVTHRSPRRRNNRTTLYRRRGPRSDAPVDFDRTRLNRGFLGY